MTSIFKRMWRGQQVDKLVLWHDQGYGDAIQNLHGLKQFVNVLVSEIIATSIPGALSSGAFEVAY